MKRIVTPEEMRQTEQAAFEKGVSSLLLMETAARQAFLRLQALAPKGGRVFFLCGPGNNGGDGLAMARMWRQAGGDARVILPKEPATPDARTNLRYLQALGVPFAEAIDRADVLVDALFGTGFHGAIDPESAMGRLIGSANAAGCPILAVDIPSGMDGLTGQVNGACIKATETVTFHAAKRGLILTSRPELVGRLTVADIGLSDDTGLLWADDLDELLPPRPATAHKGDCGRVTLYAGSMGMAGAAVVAAKAALRAGSGLVTVLCEREIMPILQTAVPNAMCRLPSDAPRADARLYGCGLPETAETWRRILALRDERLPEVWDAGALNLLAREPMMLGPNAVITPHAGEAARLLGWTIPRVTGDMPAAAEALRQKYGCNVILKSHVSVLCAANGTMAVNTAGSAALAKGGSGDALAGILVSLLGQGLDFLPAMQAACLWLGLAGQRAGEKYGLRGALTGDVIDCM
ncbi:MAG: NAD(P)H-hydrate dehydratase [Clostridia bacterium]|nr:NAD(P)H-hydrate dehydratase [Clostridia bacterium]